MKVFQREGPRLKVILNIFIMALSLYVLSKQDVAYRQTSFFENFMIESFAPMQRGVAYVKHKLFSIFDFYLMNINAKKENKQLKKKILDLENQIFLYEELALENKRLKDLLRFGEEIRSNGVLAQIVAWDGSSDFRVMRINKGLNDGIRLQSPVVTDKGLVGYVVRLTNNFSDVLTILDSNNRVDGIVQRTRSHGIIEGFSQGRCVMKYISRTEPVILNDLILTSGLGNIYPKGLEIGSISRIERESYGISQYIEIIPSVDFGRLEEVMVLVFQDNLVKREEWEALETTVDN